MRDIRHFPKDLSVALFILGEERYRRVNSVNMGSDIDDTFMLEEGDGIDTPAKDDSSFLIVK